MSTSLLYHAFGIQGYHYVGTIYKMGQIYESFQNEKIVATLWQQLSWSYFREIFKNSGRTKIIL